MCGSGSTSEALGLTFFRNMFLPLHLNHAFQEVFAFICIFNLNKKPDGSWNCSRSLRFLFQKRSQTGEMLRFPEYHSEGRLLDEVT